MTTGDGVLYTEAFVAIKVRAFGVIAALHQIPDAVPACSDQVVPKSELVHTVEAAPATILFP